MAERYGYVSGYQHGPVARIFRLGLHGCLSIEDYRGSGGMLPRKFLEIRISEIASEAILGQKHSHTSDLTRGVLHPIFSCGCMHLLSQLTSNFPERRY